ncbi:MAG: RNHCP domain-containing protein [Pseudomonadales bacterium]|nr:RNHCP domain-containing protein [Pseudomonadales bacterium]MBO6596888.1 RNHCP domain-containing protein [Pseudomonadales bacterium]MBO6658419.1 RNHCP domain-containing protein [Pseudomonadales bacterium]MBO6703559.1 RNHCP domain-containing protein [Pseudomonadales bacterium]MBO6823123.1 RNHCP domain-containing protein [Pseudomonadales bacterium]
MISTTSYGTHHRNHCPLCLWSKHVDEKPGDRASPCQGKMEPISVWVKSDKEWALVHRCTSCGVVKTNRIAGDDNPFALLSLASKPMAQPPFPVEKPG